MKKLHANLVWLAMFGFVVFGAIEPRFQGVVQSFMWVFVSLLLVCVIGAFVYIASCDDKEKLESYNKKRCAFMKVIGWVKTLAMFGALAYCGFTVLAGVFLVTALICRVIPIAAETRLKELE